MLVLHCCYCIMLILKQFKLKSFFFFFFNIHVACSLDEIDGETKLSRESVKNSAAGDGGTALSVSADYLFERPSR